MKNYWWLFFKSTCNQLSACIPHDALHMNQWQLLDGEIKALYRCIKYLNAGQLGEVMKNCKTKYGFTRNLRVNLSKLYLDVSIANKDYALNHPMSVRNFITYNIEALKISSTSL